MIKFKGISWFSRLFIAIVTMAIPLASAASQGYDPDTTNLPVLKAMPLRLLDDYSKVYKLPDDLGGNGFSSIFWTNKKTNQFAYWTIGVRQMASQTGYISNYIGRTGWEIFSVTPGYSVAAIGDLNGNGLSDLVWTSRAHDLYVWFKDANDRGYTSRYVGTYPQGWKLLGAGDIDGDGAADLIWYNEKSCQFGYWIMNGEKIVRTRAINVACGYHVAAIGDISGNGLLDVVWSGTNNDIYVWYGDGYGFKSVYGGSYPLNSELMAIGIFDATILRVFDVDRLARLDRFNVITRDRATGQLSLMAWVADQPGEKVTSGKISLVTAKNPKDINYTYRFGPVVYLGAYPSGGRYANAVAMLSGANDNPPFYFPSGTFRFRFMQWSSDSGLQGYLKYELSNYPADEYIPYSPIYELGYPEDWEVIGSSVGH